MFEKSKLKSDPAGTHDSLYDHLRGVAESMALETREASVAEDAIKAQYNYTVRFRDPYITRSDYNTCKEILEKMQNRVPLSRTERRTWDRMVFVQKLAPQQPITEVRQTGQNKEN